MDMDEEQKRGTPKDQERFNEKCNIRMCNSNLCFCFCRSRFLVGLGLFHKEGQNKGDQSQNQDHDKGRKIAAGRGFEETAESRPNGCSNNQITGSTGIVQAVMLRAEEAADHCRTGRHGSPIAHTENDKAGNKNRET